jgi:hypothetical protein
VKGDKKMSYKDKFGFLPLEVSFNLTDCAIYPVDNFEEINNKVKRYVSEGFIYPPLKDPVTERPEHLHELPASHRIEIQNTLENEKDLRLGVSGFIINLLGYIYGLRLQFCSWKFDGRVAYEPFKHHNIAPPKVSMAEDFLNHALNKYKSWDDKSKLLFTNLLFMHNRAPSYEWDWERFTIEYMVLDALWKLIEKHNPADVQSYKNNNNIRNGIPHKKRIYAICYICNLHCDNQKIDDIVKLRNDLFHEALWGGSHPCTAIDITKAGLPDHLRRLNQRIIPAVLDYQTVYVESNWTYGGTSIF